jgi:predicted N-formylglutamate amidohydrolase
MLLAMHSFTPVYKGVARPWHAGVLFNRDDRIGRIMLDLLRAEPGLVVGENEPYAVSDATDYTVPVHAEPHHLPHLELEVRQDLIADEAGEARWAALLTRLLPIACARLPELT